MERLTFEKCGELLIKNNDGECRSPCFGCESINKCNPEKIACGFFAALKKLKDYEDLEEQKKLPKLPCAVGDIVYRINTGAMIPVIGMVVTEIRYKAIRSGKIITKLMVSDDIAVKTNGCSVYYTDEIGKKIFLTKEAAEAALKEMSE